MKDDDIKIIKNYFNYDPFVCYCSDENLCLCIVGKNHYIFEILIEIE